MAMETSIPMDFRDALSREIWELYDPGVIEAEHWRGYFLLIQLDILGESSGLIWVSSDDWLWACFRSRRRIARGNWRKVESLFTAENQRFASNTFVLRGRREVDFFVDGLTLQGSTDLRLRTVKKQLFHRLKTMDRQIGRYFVRRDHE